MSTPSLGKTVLSGLAGGAAANAAMLATFRVMGFGWSGDGLLLDPARQSEKLIAVWTRLEPLPLVITTPAVIVSGLLLLAVVHAFVYRWLAPGWPAGAARRGLRFSLLIYLFSYVFWEFFTPVNQFGEPPALVALELFFWAVVAAAEGFALAWVMERRCRRAAP